MEELINEPTDITPDNKVNKIFDFKSRLIVFMKKYKYPLIVILILLFILLIFLFSRIFIHSSITDSSISPSPTITPTITYSTSPQPSFNNSQPKLFPTITKSSVTPIPTTGSNNNGGQTQNSPTPTTSLAKPEFSISYPSEGQSITFDSPSQQLCVVTIPIANTSGSVIYYNLNNSTWITSCFVPPNGQNSVQVKIRNGLGVESDIQTRNFNFLANY